jgi:hypothetical protein
MWNPAPGIRREAVKLSVILALHQLTMRTRSKKTKNNKIKLVADVWARVCDILLDRQQDRTLAKLSQTSREIHNLVAPKLYGIVRLRNYKALCLVLEVRQA